MNKTQKSAWCGVFMSVFILLVLVIRMNIGSIIKMDHLFAHLFFIIIPAVLLLLAIFFINRKRKNAEAKIDERDRFIIRRALIATFVSICVIPIVACAVAIFALEPEATILVRCFPVIIYFAYIIFILIFSAAILVQYGRGGGGNKN